MPRSLNANAVYILDALRSPRGAAKANGALSSIHPVDLLARMITALMARHQLEKNAFSDFIVGNVTQFKDQGANIAKTAAIYADVGDAVPGVTLNRYCTSGLEAVQFAALKMMAGEHSVLAGGVEMMSRVPMFSDQGAWFEDETVRSKTQFIHMGLAADWVATRYGIAREACDEFAWRSHQKAHAANALTFSSLVPVLAGETWHIHDEPI
ncbi:MAG TPA: acetyl-CoA C-acyltransferase, partial [Pseudomonadales bacterium]|nr:acetyl-CoA C-acyltransferase [Pseudomonadales bacterium]